MNYWFTADTHWGHEKVITYCNRPFSSIEEHDEKLIENWNKVVKKGDIVYHLGDFGFIRKKDLSPYNQIKALLKRLNGQVNLILGNHDCQNFNNQVLSLFASTSLLKVKSIGMQRIVMCHYSMRTWPGQHKGAWQLYGHSHGNLLDDQNSLSFDVGVDCHNYFPINFDQVKEIMSKKTFVPVDHHGRED